MALTRHTSLRPHPFFVVLFIVACAVSLEAQHSWRLIGRGMTTPTVRMFAYTADRTLLAATESGVILIDRRTNEAFIRHDAPSSAVFAFPDGVVVSVGDGVYISRSNGSSFELHATTRRSGTIRAGIDGKLYWSDGYLLERSDDTGRTWRRLREVNTGTLDEVHVMRNGDLLAQPERRLSRSTDDGETWTRLSEIGRASCRERV